MAATAISIDNINLLLLPVLTKYCPQILEFHGQVKDSLDSSPLWAFLIFYLLILISIGYFYLSKVINICKLVSGEHSITLKFDLSDNNRDEKPKELSIADFINLKIPEFKNNSWSLYNPIFIGGDLQTMFAAIRNFRYSDRLYFGRRVVKFKDGGSASLDKVIPEELYRCVKIDPEVDIPDGQTEKVPELTRYFTRKELKEQDQDTNSTKPILIILHGLSGSSAESYCRCLLSRVSKNYEFDCYVLNGRGCGETKLTSPSLFCGVWTDDLREVIHYFKETQPKRDIYTAGFSLGASILANYLGQEGEDSNVRLAVTLACPWDLASSSSYMESGFLSNNLYSPAMAIPLVKLITKHSKDLSSNEVFTKYFTKETLDKVYRLKDFDDNFTSKLFGFNCAYEYYRNGSPRNRIFNIKTPLININALDDPIIGGDSIGTVPYDESSLNPYITLINTSLGGHCAWFKWNNVRWYADPLARLFGEFHKACKSEVMVHEEQIPVKNKFVNDRLVGPFF